MCDLSAQFWYKNTERWDAGRTKAKLDHVALRIPKQAMEPVTGC